MNACECRKEGSAYGIPWGAVIPTAPNQLAHRVRRNAGSGNSEERTLEARPEFKRYYGDREPQGFGSARSLVEEKRSGSGCQPTSLGLEVWADGGLVGGGWQNHPRPAGLAPFYASMGELHSQLGR